MICSLDGCGKPAAYRTHSIQLIGLLCLKHMELMIDQGVLAESLVSLPERKSA